MKLDFFRTNPGAALPFDVVELIGLNGNGTDGDPRFPYTWAKLTDSERGALLRVELTGTDRLDEVVTGALIKFWDHVRSTMPANTLGDEEQAVDEDGLREYAEGTVRAWIVENLKRPGPVKSQQFEAPLSESRTVVSGKINLLSGEGNWDGTFGVLVRTLLTDLLSDGEPVDVEMYAGDDGRGNCMRIIGQVVGIHEDHGVKFADDLYVPIDEIITVRV